MCASHERRDDWRLWRLFAIFSLHIVFEFFGTLQVPIGCRCSNSNFSVSSIATQCHWCLSLLFVERLSLLGHYSFSFLFVIGCPKGAHALSFFLPSIEAVSLPCIEVLSFFPWHWNSLSLALKLSLFSMALKLSLFVAMHMRGVNALSHLLNLSRPPQSSVVTHLRHVHVFSPQQKPSLFP